MGSSIGPTATIITRMSPLLLSFLYLSPTVGGSAHPSADGIKALFPSPATPIKKRRRMAEMRPTFLRLFNSENHQIFLALRACFTANPDLLHMPPQLFCMRVKKQRLFFENAHAATASAWREEGRRMTGSILPLFCPSKNRNYRRRRSSYSRVGGNGLGPSIPLFCPDEGGNCFVLHSGGESQTLLLLRAKAGGGRH